MVEVKPFTFKGLIAPVFTPITTDNAVSVIANLELDYAKHLLCHEIHGILVNGTSGEFMSQNIHERKLTAELWAKAGAVTKQHIMIQVGGTCLPDVLELAKHAQDIGADSILCLPELYIKPNTPQELVDYLTIVSKAAPKLPLLYYHIPMFTNVNIHMGQFLRDYASKIPNFVGIKFTSNLLDEGIEALIAHNRKYAVFLGADHLLFPAFASGFDSAIATTLNIFPRMGLEILKETAQNKDLHAAKSAQDKLTSVVKAITKNGGWVPTMKAAMNLYSPIKVGKVRLPLKEVSDEAIKEMAQDIDAIRKQ